MICFDRFAAQLSVLTFSLLLFGCFSGAKPRYVEYPRTSKKLPAPQTEPVPESADDPSSDESTIDGDVGATPEDAELRPASEPRNYSLSASTLSWRLAEELLPFLHTPYKYGGEDTSGVDCSGLTKVVYEKAFSIVLPHKAALQIRQGKRVKRTQLMAGDLVFFYQKNRRRINHVGLYLADDQFIHSASSKGVVISDLNSPYWQKHYAGARRLLFLGKKHR